MEKYKMTFITRKAMLNINITILIKKVVGLLLMYKHNGEFTPSSRDYTLPTRGSLGVRFGKWHSTVHNDCQRCRNVSFDAQNWPRYTCIHDVSTVFKQIKSRHIFAHCQKCCDISSMSTAAWCELAIRHIQIFYRISTI